MGAFKQPHGGELKELYLPEHRADEVKEADAADLADPTVVICVGLVERQLASVGLESCRGGGFLLGVRRVARSALGFGRSLRGLREGLVETSALMVRG